MNGTFSASEVLGAMITPAVLISASGTLVLSTSNRLTRVVDRVRVLATEAEKIRKMEGEASFETRSESARSPTNSPSSPGGRSSCGRR